MHPTQTHPGYQQSGNRADAILWACAIVAVLLGLAAIAQQQASQNYSPAVGEFPTMSEPMPTAEGFQAVEDGRVPPGEAIIGVNEVSWRSDGRPQQCIDCQPSYNAASSRAPAPVYPAGYQPYYQPANQYDYQQSSSSGCDCDDCNCRRFPVARRVIRGAARVVSWPIRRIRGR